MRFAFPVKLETVTNQKCGFRRSHFSLRATFKSRYWLTLGATLHSFSIRRSILWIALPAFAAHSSAAPLLQDSPAVSRVLSQAQSAEDRGDVIDALRNYNAALQVDPDNTGAIFNVGRLKAKCRDFQGAIAAFRKAIQVVPTFAEAHYNLGLALIAASGSTPDWASAMPEFATALKLRRDYPEASNMVGVGEMEMGKASDALPVFQSALALNSNSAQLHYNYGRALESTGKMQEAAAEYASALRIRKDYPEAHSALGHIQVENGDFSSAVVEFRAALKSTPDMDRAHYGLARALTGLGQTREARIEFQQADALIQHQSDVVLSSHLSNEGLDLAKKGDLANSILTIRRAIELDPVNAIAHYNLGLLLADAGDLSGGLLELRKSISLMPMQLSSYVTMAQMQLKRNDRTSALATLQKAALVDPNDQFVRSELATLHEGKSLPKSGEPAPQDDAALFRFGAPEESAAAHRAFAARLTNEGDDVGAVGELRRALSLQPANQEIRYQLALVYQLSGDTKNAQLELRKILYASPDSPGVHLALGALLLKADNNADAVTELKRALAIQPDNQDAIRILAQAEAASNHR